MALKMFAYTAFLYALRNFFLILSCVGEAFVLPPAAKPPRVLALSFILAAARFTPGIDRKSYFVDAPLLASPFFVARERLMPLSFSPGVEENAASIFNCCGDNCFADDGWERSGKRKGLMSAPLMSACARAMALRTV